MNRKLLLLSIFVLVQLTAFAQLIPQNFNQQVVLADVNRAVGITFDETGRMFYWEKRGVVYVVEDGVKITPPLLDISDEIRAGGDHGLTGLALHPDFLNNGYFYCVYQVDPHHLQLFGTAAYNPNYTHWTDAAIGRLTRYTADVNDNFHSVVEGSRKVLMGKDKADGIPIMDSSHGTGDIAFAADGTMIVGLGDGSAWKGPYIGGGPPYFESKEAQGVPNGFYPPEQDVGSYRAMQKEALGGKVIRIDPETGDGVPSNPYYDPANPRAAQSRVWALGFRNPFRLTVRPGTGATDPAEGRPGSIYVGDVSGGFWEELNVITVPGKNYGWPLFDLHEPHNQFTNLPRENFYAPNPLYPSACDDPFFTFHDLVKNDTKGGARFPNPCDTREVIPPTYETYTNERAAVAWYHTYRDARLTTPQLVVPTYDELGNPTQTVITDLGMEGENWHGIAIVGGDWYMEDQFPEKYKGAYFVADHDGWIQAFHFDLNDSLENVSPILNDTFKIVDIAVNPVDGCLYYVRYNYEIMKICYGGNLPPVAEVTVDKTYGPSPLEVNFDASASYDPLPLDGEITYFWDFGDGSTSTEASPTHIFESNTSDPTSFTVVLTLTDSAGDETKEQFLISLNNTPPEVEITSFNDGDFYPLGGPTWLPLTATATDKEHGEEELTYLWETFLHHNNHYHPEHEDALKESHAVISGIGCEVEIYYYRIRLTVTDKAGLETVVESFIYPDCVEPFVTGLEMSLNRNNEVATVHWTNLSEGAAKYEIQQAPDEVAFETVRVVDAEGHGFNYRESGIPLHPGLNSFRLKMINQEGQAYYSEAQTLLFIPGSMRVFPNPSSGILFVDNDESISGETTLTLYDLFGRVMFTQTWQLLGPSRRVINISEVDPGLYFYKVESGNFEISGKVIKE